MKIEKATILTHYDSESGLAHIMSNGVVTPNDLYNHLLNQDFVQSAELCYSRDDDNHLTFEKIHITVDNGWGLYIYSEQLHQLSVEGYARTTW